MAAIPVGDYERDAVERLVGFAPDIVLVPGDLYQFDADLLDERAPQFTQLIERIVDEVPLVYLVSGNTDTVAGLRQITGGTGARVLDNEIDTFELKGGSVSIGGTTLLGDDAAARRMARLLAGNGKPDCGPNHWPKQHDRHTQGHTQARTTGPNSMTVTPCSYDCSHVEKRFGRGSAGWRRGHEGLRGLLTQTVDETGGCRALGAAGADGAAGDHWPKQHDRSHTLFVRLFSC